jgi:hypothetical protein
MYIYVADGHAASDYWLETAPDYRHWFNISYAGAEALVLQTWADAEGIHLDWTQDDFETLAGFNIYRGQQLDENGMVADAVKINELLIPAEDLSYVDSNVVEGETYHYYFTVVQTDFAESDGSNVSTCTALDMTDPVIEHLNRKFPGGGGFSELRKHRTESVNAVHFHNGNIGSCIVFNQKTPLDEG